MADGLTTQSATPATVPASSLIATVDLGTRGHAQVMLMGGATTASVTTVGDSTTSAQMLAANTARVGATFVNDSNSAAYVKMGTTASSSSYTVKMGPGSYWEVPFGYNGRIDAIWITDAGGQMVITELT